MLIAEGGFREDLYYRIGEIVVEVPPLRVARATQRCLPRRSFGRFAAEQRGSDMTLLGDAIEAIESHLWPGNVPGRLRTSSSAQ